MLDSFVSQGGTLLLGAQRGSIYRSQDGGSSWTMARRGLPDGAVNELVFVGDRLLAATVRGVCISTDKGETWREPAVQISYWLPGKITIADSQEVRSLALSGARVFAATWGGGAFRSADKGETWEQSSEGLESEDSADALYVKSFITSDRRLLAGTQMGVFATSDNGGRWRESNNGFARRPIDRLFTLNGQIYATNIGAGAFASSDNGLSWEAFTFPEAIAHTAVGRVAGFHESYGKLWAFSSGLDGASGVG